MNIVNNLVKIVLVIILIIILFYSVLSIALKNSNKQEVKQIEIKKQAAIAIYTRGQRLNLYKSEYFNKSPEVFFDVPIDNNTNEIGKINITKESVTWKTFFNTLPITINDQCIIVSDKESYCDFASTKLKFYLNGNEVDNIFDKTINNKDRLLVTFGYIDSKMLESQIASVPVVN